MALSNNYMRYAAYYIVGYGTEYSEQVGVYKIAYAGSGSSSTSGISIGITQTDFYQKTDFLKQLIAVYNTYKASSDPQISYTDLHVQGSVADNFVDSDKGAALNRFFQTQNGQELVNYWDTMNQIQMGNDGNILQNTTLFNKMNAQDQFIIMSTAMKVSNQTGNMNGIIALFQGQSKTLSDGSIHQIYNTDSSEVIRQKIYNYSQHFGAAAAEGARKAFAIADRLYEVYSSPAFSAARTFLEGSDNAVSGLGSNDIVSTQLGVLRALSVNNTVTRGSYQGFLIDPLTKNLVYKGTNGRILYIDNKTGINGYTDNINENHWETITNGKTSDGEIIIKQNIDKKGKITNKVIGLNEDGSGYLINEDGIVAMNVIETNASLLADALIDNKDPADLIAILTRSTGLAANTITYMDIRSDATNGSVGINSLSLPISELQNMLNNGIQPIADESGQFVTVSDGSKSFILTVTGQIVKYDQTSNKVLVLTGEYADTTFSIGADNVVDNKMLGNIALSLSAGVKDGMTSFALPSDIKNSVTLSNANGTRSIVFSNLFDDNGTQIGTVQTNTTVDRNGRYTTIETQSFNDKSPTITILTTTDSENHLFTAQYQNGRFVGLTQIDGASVSPAFNQLFIANLKESMGGDTAPSVSELANEIANSDSSMQVALDKTLASSVTGTDYYGNPVRITQTESTIQTIGNTIGTLTDALSLVRAIQSGEPLPITVTGLRLAADLDFMDGTRDMPNLGAAASVGSAILSVYSLANALENGDGIAAVSSAAYVVKGAADAALFLQTSGAISELPASIGSLSSTLNTAIPYLNIVNSIAHGDALGAGLAAAELAMMNAGLYTVPYIGWAYAIYSIVDSLFGGDEIPDPWGTGRFVWDGTSIRIQSAGETGGNEAVSGVMQSVITAMNSLIEQQRLTNPTSSLGIIANRMPSVAYDMSGYRYTDIDPLTGEERHPALRFDTSGNPYNATPGSTESYQSIGEAIIMSALERQAIAPMWEVQTAKMQTDAGDPKAGLTEEARAGRDGQLAAAVTGDTQTFRPVALDLNGNLEIDTLSKAASGVSFDVDDSGYLKETAWVGAGDAFLTLDRDYNGETNSGREMFSNSTVALGRRGLAGMGWVDANYDGKITSADPVWNELRVWQDANSDGLEAEAESLTLGELGITELNYAMGTFTQNGVKKLLSSPDLEADTAGVKVNVVPEGILIDSSSDGLSLLVTRIDDMTAVQANQDGISGYEDIEMIVSGTDLLANDEFGGFTGRDLELTGVSNFRHGSGFIDPNGFVHFTPEANYAGSDAGFDYTTTATANGQNGTGNVIVTVQNVNDAPTLDHVNHTTRSVYGYTAIQYDGDGYYMSGGEPIYQPYYTSQKLMKYDPAADEWRYVTEQTLHDVPIAHEDAGTGTVIGADVDDPASSLTYTIVNGPQYGSVAMDAQGNYTYVSWKEPNIPSDRIVENGQYAALKDGYLYTQGNLSGGAVYATTDVFQVKITDPHGASVTQNISVPHFGPYLPPTPSGGGGKKPISVDLGGDGFDFINVDDSNVFFDITGDGWKRRTAWVGASDGLLAFDSDGNGKIETSGEISFVGYKDGAQSDLEGLSAFDTNSDGIFSALDAKWNQFGVWQDANSDGITDEGEFKSLSEMGIASISLTSDGKFSIINEQTVHGVGSMQMADGSAMAIADVTLEYSNETQVHNSDGTTSSVVASPFSPDGEEINGTEDKDLILGKNGNNIINAFGGDDVIFEDGGNDVIDAGEGNDIVYAGADNDIVFAQGGDDLVYGGLGDDMIFGGDGHDAIFADGGNDVVFAGSGNDMVTGGYGNDVISGDDGDDMLYGESGNDALFGRDGNDELYGTDGYDLLNGGAGDDLLDGGSEADEMVGGTGDDTYVVDNAVDIVTEAANEGNDTVIASIDYTLAATLENLTLSGDAINGTGNDADNRLIGNANNNRLEGKAGNDTLNGGIGTDTMIGGSGNDLYIIDNVGDVVIENATEGIDTVRASVSYTLSDNVEHLTLTGSASINATGNALDNTLIGNSGNNILDAKEGIDTMIGGKGDDVYIVDNTADIVTEYAGEGVDTVRSSVTRTLETTVENLILTGTTAINATGNDMSNILIGNGAANILDGQAGSDAMAGYGGDDTYIVDNVGDTVYESVDAGDDHVIASVTYTLSDNVERLTLVGTDAIDATGNNLDNVLIGNSADNVLDGKAGADTMIGKAGNDTYIVDNSADSVVETADNGIDTIISSVSYVLPEHVENMILSGSDNISATGNELNNVIIGNSANNVLDGKAGMDTMSAGDGDDTYYVDTIGDTVLENIAEGIDTIKTTVTYTASANVERLELIGTDNIDGYGNELDNTLIGNSGNNRLDGQSGMDTMSGGDGDDTYIVDNVSDTVVEEIDAGDDHVISSVTYTLSDNVERLTLVGIETIDGTGNVLDNTLIGNSANNILNGKEGIDTMIGGDGNDTYYVDAQNDTVFENVSEGLDTIYTTVSYVLPENVENLILIGDGNINAGGNGLDNILIGNGSNNVISGGAGKDLLDGKAGNDTLEGGIGDDILVGGSGNDTFVYNLGDGLDTISDEAGEDTVRFTEGFSLDNVALRVVDTDGVLTAQVRVLNAGGCEIADQGFDFTVTKDSKGNYVSPIEHFAFNDGSSKTFDDLLIKTQTTYASHHQTTIMTGRNDDIIYGNSRTNIIYAGTGNDIVYAASGGDKIYGQGGNDTLFGNTGNDTIDGGCGTDILSGSNGEDTLVDTLGNNAFLGGSHDDVITAGEGNDFIAGGYHDDILNGGGGYNVFAFNRGDGHDTILPSVGAHNTLSLNDVDYRDISLRKNGTDLIVDIGCNSQVTLKSWYGGEANRNFDTLQIVSSEYDYDFNHHGWEVEETPYVETFDFKALVEAFDAAKASNPRLNTWNAMNTMLQEHLNTSNSMALGGDLAFAYAKEGDLSRMSIGAAQDTLSSPAFGIAAQLLTPEQNNLCHH